MVSLHSSSSSSSSVLLYVHREHTIGNGSPGRPPGLELLSSVSFRFEFSVGLPPQRLYEGLLGSGSPGHPPGLPHVY